MKLEKQKNILQDHILIFHLCESQIQSDQQHLTKSGQLHNFPFIKRDYLCWHHTCHTEHSVKLSVSTCCCMASSVSHTFEKDTMIFQGPSLNQFGQNPLYRAKKPSFFHV